MNRWKIEPTRITLPLLISAATFGGLAWIGLYGIQYINGFKTPQPLWYGLIAWLLMTPIYFFAVHDNRKNHRSRHKIAIWKYAAALFITLALDWHFLMSTINLDFNDLYLDGRKWYLQLAGAGCLYLLTLGVLSMRRKPV